MTLELNFEISGQVPQSVELNQPTMMAGTLASNHIVLRAPKVDPIHALFESDDHGNWTVTDLGSVVGVKLNGQLIEVESSIKVGDTITIGSVNISLNTIRELAPPPVPHHSTSLNNMGAATADLKAEDKPNKGRGSGAKKKQETKKQKEALEGRDRPDQPILFSPRDAKPSGRILECVAYWGDTILEVEHFQPGVPGFEEVTIGDPTIAHFIAAGKDNIESHVLATVTENGYELDLQKGMEARLRKGGKVEKAEAGTFKLGRRDIAHIKYGAVRYFLLYVQPPELKLPKDGIKDRLFLRLMSFAMLFFSVFISTFWMMDPVDKDQDKDDIWSIVHAPETLRPEKKIFKEKKPPIKIASVKKPPPPKKVPPPPKVKVKPVKPIAKEKVKKPKPKAVKKSKKPLVMRPPPKQVPPKPAVKKPAKRTGPASTGARKPNNRLAGAESPNKKLGKSGGAKGSGMNKKGGRRKGKTSTNVKGVAGVKNKKASGVNLGKLGLGAGLVLSKTGAGAIRTNFRSSAGGAGGGSGSGTKNLGLGGLGNGKSLGIAGTGNAVNNFGHGSGGLLSGQGGSGGNGLGNSFGNGRGRGQVRINIPIVAPAVSGGLTNQEVLGVINTHINEIRHCYEQMLQRSPSITGKLNAKFTILLNGRVKFNSFQNSTISDRRMKGCVSGRIKRWKFPKPRGSDPVKIGYPFDFTSS